MVIEHAVKVKHYGREFAVLLILFLAMVAFLQNNWTFNDRAASGQSAPAVINQTELAVKPQSDLQTSPAQQQEDEQKQLLDHINKSSRQQDEQNGISLSHAQLVAWVKKGDYTRARHYLMKKASMAVDAEDNKVLGQIMQLLGRVSATEGDLASTEVYLFEALDIFKGLADQPQVANTHMLLGKMYAKRRAVAKRAGNAYDDLLLSRLYLNKGQSYRAKEMLDSSIEKNIELGRTGAVASAYKSLASYYGKQQNFNEERDALMQAANYYAESGQAKKARQMLTSFNAKHAASDDVDRLAQQIDNKLNEYQSQVKLVRQARDYIKLYSLYKAKGQQARAWEFRVKASEILSQSSKRDLYYRSPDVMALLFDSNTNLDKAEDYYAKARDSYLDQNNFAAYEAVLDFQQALN